MLKILATYWAKNHNDLKEYLEYNYKQLNNLSYKDIVKITFEQIFNCNDRANSETLNLDNIIEIDNGDFQGTLLFVIPFDTYQPNPSEYLITYIYYGSCSGCDTLQSLHTYYSNYDPVDETMKKREEQVNGYMSLCKDILMNTIKPYNTGWRHSEEWDNMEWDGEF